MCGDRRSAFEMGRDSTSLTEAALIEWSRDKLAGFKRPTSVDFVETLPRNASGKLLKRTLREPYWVGYTRRVN
jgi:long-chain acyl-CoA synthetase